MKTYIIEPLAGVGPVRLGMTRDEVRKAMLPGVPEPFWKTPFCKHPADAFHAGAFQVFYVGESTEAPRVEYIRLSRCGDFQARFMELDIFGTPAEELLAALGRVHHFEGGDAAAPCDVIFPGLEMSLGRPGAPGLAGGGDQAGRAGRDEGRYFSTAGISIRGYR